MGDDRQNLVEMLMAAAQQGASDIHLSPGHYPTVRVDRRLVPLSGQKILDKEVMESYAQAMLGDKQELFSKIGGVTFAFDIEQRARFRVSVYKTTGGPSAALRFIPPEIPSLEQLNLPAVVSIFTKLSQGLVIAASPSGHGATTTMSALVNVVNRERAEKIVTIESPVEHLFTADKSIVDQREVGKDVPSFSGAIRDALRQDANIIAVGDLDSAEEIDAALLASEAGRLVYAVARTGSAVETLERMISRFPAERQDEIRNRFAGAIAGTVCQRLVPHLKGGLIPVMEIMVATTAVRTHIRDNRLRQIDQAVETGYDMGMMSLDRSLADRVRRKEISLENAEAYSHNPNTLRTLIA